MDALATAPGTRVVARAATLPLAMRGVLALAVLQLLVPPIALATQRAADAPLFRPFQVTLAATFAIAALILRCGGCGHRRAQWLMAFYTLAGASFTHPILQLSSVAAVQHVRWLALDG